MNIYSKRSDRCSRQCGNIPETTGTAKQSPYLTPPKFPTQKSTMQYIHIRFVEPEQKKGQDPELQHSLVLSEQIHGMRVGNCPEFATLCGIPGPMCLDYIHNMMRIGEHIAQDGLLNSQQGLSGGVTNDEQGLFHGVTGCRPPSWSRCRSGRTFPPHH